MSKKPKTKVKLELTRRDFLVVAGAAAGSVVAAEALTTGLLSPFANLKQQQVEGVAEAAHGGSSGFRWGMVINLDKCIGCAYCQRACSATNDVAAGMEWNIVVEEKTTAGNTFFFTRPCLHCQHAPCVEVCPVKATYLSGGWPGGDGLRPVYWMPLLPGGLPLRRPPLQLGKTR